MVDLKQCVLLLVVSIASSSLFHTCHAIKHATPRICLNSASSSDTHANRSRIYDNLKCESASLGLFIIQVEYTNDFMNECANTTSNTTTATTDKCAAYPTQLLADFCNGKRECLVKLEPVRFKYGFNGATCDFDAHTLMITYECVPTHFTDPAIPKYDICADHKTLEHPIHGFVHSPHYPNNYDSQRYCQMTIRPEAGRRLEIFLVEMELEGLSKRTAMPTDYLLVADRSEKLFGRKAPTIVYNDSADAMLVFKSDFWFTKRGFFLYFQSVANEIEQNHIELVEESDDHHQPTTALTTATGNKLMTSMLTTNMSTNSTSSGSLLHTSHSFSSATSLSQSSLSAVLPLRMQTTIVESIAAAASASPLSDTTMRTIGLLMLLVVALSSVIIYLVLTNRKRIFRNDAHVQYKTAGSLSRYNDGSDLSGYVDLNPPTPPPPATLFLVPPPPTLPPPPPLVHQKSTRSNNATDAAANTNKVAYHVRQRASDNSTAHLLSFNDSSMCDSITMMPAEHKQSIENDDKTTTTTLAPCTEVYEDLQIDQKPTGQRSEPYKPNEYCYIPCNNLQTLAEQRGFEDESGDKPRPISSLLSSPSSASSHKSSSSSSSSACADSTMSPLISDKFVTSTPSVPKSQPPTMPPPAAFRESTVANNAQVAAPTGSLAEPAACKRLMMDGTSAGNETNYYQVPTNLPKEA